MPQNWELRRLATDGNLCPECGGQVKGGRGGCQLLFDEITYAMQTNPRIAAIHRLSVDTYCMQHVESYCASAKSYAAHLIGLWWGVQHLDNPAPIAPPLQSINLNTNLIKPPILSNRGTLTLPAIMEKNRPDTNVEQFTAQIREWAVIVWQAYESQHPLVQAWVK